jgi:hypothetical protein
VVIDRRHNAICNAITDNTSWKSDQVGSHHFVVYTRKVNERNYPSQIPASCVELPQRLPEFLPSESVSVGYILQVLYSWSIHRERNRTHTSLGNLQATVCSRKVRWLRSWTQDVQMRHVLGSNTPLLLKWHPSCYNVACSFSSLRGCNRHRTLKVAHGYCRTLYIRMNYCIIQILIIWLRYGPTQIIAAWCSFIY